MNLISKKCIKGYELKVFKSPAGYYVGTVDEEEIPNCKISGYYKKERGC